MSPSPGSLMSLVRLGSRLGPGAQRSRCKLGLNPLRFAPGVGDGRECVRWRQLGTLIHCQGVVSAGTTQAAKLEREQQHGEVHRSLQTRPGLGLSAAAPGPTDSDGASASGSPLTGVPVRRWGLGAIQQLPGSCGFKLTLVATERSLQWRHCGMAEQNELAYLPHLIRTSLWEER